MTLTSCNTEFRNNKRFLTNLKIPSRTRDPTLTDRDTISYSSVRDTISKFTAMTPRSMTSDFKNSVIKSRTSTNKTTNHSNYHAANPNPQLTTKNRNEPIKSYE